MDFIANYWFVWLAVFLLCTIYAVCNQLARFKRVAMDIEGSQKDDVAAITKGMASLAAASIFMGLSGLLLIVAIVIHTIRYVSAL